MNPPIADLHCDLLLYLSGGKNRTPFDEESRCSIPQLKMGGVKLQVLPIFSETRAGSSRSGEKQLEIFGALPKEHFVPLEEPALPRDKVAVLLAFENASAFCSEDEDLQKRLQWLTNIPHKILYISLTWNSENRFGGGALTTMGLKEEGRHLLDFLHQRKICVDLSHASDPFAFDILKYCDQRQLDIPIIASHSNFRSVTEGARNLPDALAMEIIARGGVIGLNFVGRFVGKSPQNVYDHLEHMLQLNGGNQYCFVLYIR